MQPKHILIAAIGLIVLFFLYGMDAELDRQEQRDKDYCALAGHSETYCKRYRGIYETIQG